jgi:hypothetical protein
MNPDPQPNQPHRHIQIDVIIVLPRRLVWLLAGIATANFFLPGGLLDKVTLLLQAGARLVR